MGQPPDWEFHVTGSGVIRPARDPVGLLALGLHRPITNPVTGLLGVQAEAYALVGRGVDPGARLLATTRALGLSAGADWNDRGGVSGIVSFQAAVQRGGLLGGGSMLRVDWLPWRDQTWNVGLQLPIGRPFAGRTRSRSTDVALPMAPKGRRMPLSTALIPEGALVGLRAVESAAARILAYTNLYARDTAGIRYGESFIAATRSYDAGLKEAFGIAAGNIALADTITRAARAVLLDEVLLPYDALFGQVKDPPDGIRELTSSAQGRFVRWLNDSSRVSTAHRAAVASVYARVLRIVEGIHENLLSQWGDSRLVWLPLQMALTEDQYDEQIEVDRLIETAVQRANGIGDHQVQRFTDRNSLTYLRSSDLPLEIARSIFAARDYHVLWTHDFTGRRDQTKELDEIAYTMVADAYLPALTQAVQRYDSTRHMPLYVVLQDQFYYEQRDGRIWMDILKDPLNASISLPPAYSEWESHLRERQNELRQAVAGSWLLGQDATANGGHRWVRRAVKVHVNILHPSDFSFRSHRILPPFPFIPDNIMRDHRKLVLYDLNEGDPYGGALIIMGVGIGEHYASATWEDRGYRVRGPAALEARAAVRRALRANGLGENQLPPPLRADSMRSRDDSIPSTYVGRALQVHNEAGFGAKRSSVARAMLYNLAPAGSVIIVPDPLWVSETWAAMLAGAAARGCRVYVIAPSLANNPNPHAPIVAVMHDVMGELVGIGRRLENQISAAGGELRVGLYTAAAPVTDADGRQREIRQGLLRYPWIREVFPFDDNALALLDRATAQTEADGSVMADDERPRAPQLHQKTQLIARPGAMAALVRQPGWDDVLAHALRVQSRQTERFADQIAQPAPDADSATTNSADAIMRRYEQTLTATDRKAVSFYFSAGMQNQDPRGIMLDGEATLIVSGLHAAAGVVDLFHIMTRSTWLEGQGDLDRLLPRPGGLMGRIARLIRLAL